MRRGPMKPFAAGGRRSIAAILVLFAAVSAFSVWVSIGATQQSRHRAAVLEVSARQRTLAQRYVSEVFLARQGRRVDPATTASVMRQSARALVDGGTAPAVLGDDDEIRVPAAVDRATRTQLEQERRLVTDLTATGAALLAGRPVEAIPETAHEHVVMRDPMARLRELAALTSNVALNSARSFAARDDRNVKHLIDMQVALGIGGLMASLLLAWALIAATRRKTAHFRSLISSSTDLVLVFADGGCRYVSESVTKMLDRGDGDLLEERFIECVHPDERAAVGAVAENAEPSEIVFRVTDKFGEWRHLEARVTDLRRDRNIRGVLLNARDVTERVRLEDELTHQAFHDNLTGLANRALFRDRLDIALARSERSREPLAIMLVDLDGFKQVNDSLGHSAGDDLLRGLGRRIVESTRASDTVARLGGDEFALLIENADEAHATATAKRLLDSLARPLSAGGRELAVDASIGIVNHTGGDVESDDLMRNADFALYSAKRAGRGRCEVFRVDMAGEFGDLLDLEQDLRLGLQNGEFSLHYQPEVSIDGSTVVGVEALLRWHSPTRGSVSPAEFIPLAESSGLILPIGEFVVNEACGQAAKWRSEGTLPAPFVTWVNISGKQLSAGGVNDLVVKALAAAALPAECLGLEVTESAIVEGGAAGERARAELQELHDLGVKIAIDDFGTGFSSLS
jgi:diguanylate cyclase (GGDEF)-like protein/PAS domain S-box-containing protein